MLEVPIGGSSTEKITSNRLAIEKGSLIAGNISFQIRNIASLIVSEIRKSGLWFLILLGVIFGGGLIVAIFPHPLGFLLGAVLGGFGAYYLFRKSFKSTYQLRLITNAATTFLILHDDEQFLLRLKSAIEDVMQKSDGSTYYQVNIAEQKIEKVEANTTTVSGSPGAAVIGGSAYNVQQSTNVQVVNDVNSLLELVERSNDQNREFFEFHLKVIKQYVEGLRPRDDAKRSWDKLNEHLGALMRFGGNVAELVARIASLFS